MFLPEFRTDIKTFVEGLTQWGLIYYCVMITVVLIDSLLAVCWGFMAMRVYITLDETEIYPELIEERIEDQIKKERI